MSTRADLYIGDAVKHIVTKIDRDMAATVYDIDFKNEVAYVNWIPQSTTKMKKDIWRLDCCLKVERKR